MISKESLLKDKDSLDENSYAYLFSNLTRICNEYDVRIESYISFNILDINSNEIVEGDIYEEVWDLIEFIEERLRIPIGSFSWDKNSKKITI